MKNEEKRNEKKKTLRRSLQYEKNGIEVFKVKMTPSQVIKWSSFSNFVSKSQYYEGQKNPKTLFFHFHTMKAILKIKKSEEITESREGEGYGHTVYNCIVP